MKPSEQRLDALDAALELTFPAGVGLLTDDLTGDLA
jgi:hypothetical protein